MTYYITERRRYMTSDKAHPHRPMDWLGMWPNLTLTLEMVSQTQQNSTNRWIGWAFVLT
jgi:hypothetical protein